MADQYDPYREKLVMETETIWPDEFDTWEPGDRMAAEIRLHAEPDKAAELEYVRMHTGFLRRIIVTPQDLARIGMA